MVYFAKHPALRNADLSRAESIARGLFPHQIEGVAFLLRRRRAILADDMGLGKTRQAIVAMHNAEPEGPYLVVCPASVKLNWAREIETVLPGAPVRILDGASAPVAFEDGHATTTTDESGPNAAERRALHAGQLDLWCSAPENAPLPRRAWVVVNYDILARHVDALERVPWAGLIFDEAHYIKNHRSQRSRYARRLVDAATERRPGGPAVYALTGTPLMNRPRDLFPLLQLVGHPMGRSFLSFAKRYCAAYHNGYGWVTDGASNLEELAVQLQGVMLRRAKTDVLELPPKLRTWLAVDVPAGTAAAEMREAVGILLRAATGAGKASGGSEARSRLVAHLTTARRKLALAKVHHTIDLIESAVEQGEKVIVFSCFDEPLQRIHRHFADRSVLLTGATPSTRRQELVDRFQDDDGVRVFAANILAGGVGLNLTSARQVVFNDLDWVPANHWQAEDRAYRIGQTNTVNVTYVVAAGTVDDFVRELLEAKAALVEGVVEGRALTDAATRDVLSELERLIGELSPQLAELRLEDLDAEDAAAVLREAAQVFEREHAALRAAGGQDGDREGGREPSAAMREALRILADAIAAPVVRRYRVASNSKPGTFYEITVDAALDVSCTCPGFSYRGMCSHARELKAALATAAPLPAGCTAVRDDR
ncbi:MAG TPA: DEAD/DEAH box helicase [Longimicrobiales bacterium]